MVRRVMQAVLLGVLLTTGAGPAPAASDRDAGVAPPGRVAAVVRPGAAVAVAAPPEVTRPRAAFGWPLPGFPSVTRAFEPPPHPYGRGHRGVDLAGVPGSPVLAAGAGTVVFASPLAGRGVVSIDHSGGLRTTYEPVHNLVAPGAVVGRGDPIGTLEPGHHGCPVPACLHWGVRRGTEYLDPLQLLAPGPLRLLPWDGNTD